MTMINVYMDSCAFYPPQEPDKKASKRLFDLYDEDKISIEIPYGVKDELSKLKHTVRKKMLDKTYTIRVPLTSKEEIEWQDVKQILFGDRSDLRPNDVMDINNVFEAQKYGCVFFVTCDKRHILSKASLLFARFRLQVMSPSQCLRVIEEYLAKEPAYYSDLFKYHS